MQRIESQPAEASAGGLEKMAAGGHCSIGVNLSAAASWSAVTEMRGLSLASTAPLSTALSAYEDQ
jgi:hypothetical protein